MPNLRFSPSAVGKLPQRREWAADVAGPLTHWIRWGSWRFCARCGHVRPDGRLTALSRPFVHNAAAFCSAKVSVSIYAHQYEIT